MNDAQIILTVLTAVIFRFYAEPLPDLFLIRQVIILCLHISIDEYIFPRTAPIQVQQCLVRARDVRPMLNVMSGICQIESVLPLMIDLRKVLLFRRDAKFQLHKIQTALAVDVVCQRLAAQYAVITVVAQRDAPRRDIAEQLVAKPLPPQ